MNLMTARGTSSVYQILLLFSFLHYYIYGSLQATKSLRTYTKYANSDYPAYVQSIIRALPLLSYIKECSIILIADSEDPD